jgi:hypothetical protein
MFSKEEFQQIKKHWENSASDKRGPEPCNDFVTVFRNRSLVTALWSILDSYMELDFADTDSAIAEACERVKEELGIPD